MSETFVPPATFSRFASRNSEMLRILFAEAASITFFDIRTDGIQAADLLSDQFTPSIVFVNNLRIGPEIIEQLAGELINTE